MTLKIGLTGGIGSGKSTISKVFSILNIPVYEADVKAKYLIENNQDLLKDIKTLLGPDSYFPNGQYNKVFVAQKVFGNPILLEKLNILVHPRVRADFEKWVLNHSASKMVIKEAAIMKKDNQLDKIIVVVSPVGVRIERILKRDSFRTKEDVYEILKRQKNEKEYLEIADFIIKNDEAHLVIPQVLKIIDKLSKVK